QRGNHTNGSDHLPNRGKHFPIHEDGRGLTIIRLELAICFWLHRGSLPKNTAGGQLRFGAKHGPIPCGIMFVAVAAATCFSPRSLLTFLDRSGLSENHQGGKTGGPHSTDEILSLRAKLWREKEFRGYSSVGRASRSQ